MGSLHLDKKQILVAVGPEPVLNNIANAKDAQGWYKYGQTAAPLGQLKRQKLTADFGPITVDQDTDMTLTGIFGVAGRSYPVHVHRHMNINSVVAGARWNINLKVNGSVYDRFDSIGTGVTGTFRYLLDAEVDWEPTSDTLATLVVAADEIVDGSDLTFLGASGASSIFKVSDNGLVYPE